jgi:hypothetical protein
MRLISFAGSGLIFLLLLSGMLLNYLGIPALVSTYASSDQVVGLIVFGGGLILSLIWCVLPAMIAGQSISRDRGMRTNDLLATTPFPAESIVLARAASDLRNVWSLLLNSVLLCILSVLPALVWLIFVQIQLGSESGQPVSLLFRLIFATVAMIASVIERAQELALSVVLGIAAGVVTKSTSFAQLIGFFAGLAMRILQLLCVVLLLKNGSPSSVFVLSLPVFTVVGSGTLFVVDPRLTTIILLCWLYLSRESLIHLLIRYILNKVTDQ